MLKSVKKGRKRKVRNSNRSFEEGTKPFKSFGIALLPGNTAHEDLDRAGSLIPFVAGLHSQRLSELVLRNCPSLVDFIAQDDDGYFLKFRHLQDALQLDATLFEAFGVGRINEIDDAIDIGDIVPPGFPGSFVPAEVPGLEGDLTHGEFL